MTRQSLDYIFWLKNTNAHTDSGLHVALKETRVEKLPCEGLPCRYCSDHFGVSAVLSKEQS